MSFSSEARERSRPLIPLASMVDIMFLLLIFFMTAAVFRDAEAQIPVTLPGAKTAAAASAGGRATRIYITVTKTNRIYLGQQELTLSELGAKLRQLAALDRRHGRAGREQVVVRGDHAIPWGLGIQIVDAAQQAGFTDVEVGTVKPKARGQGD